jgi:hypothetical protein
MGVGNTVAGTNATAGSGTYTIQPSGAAEWIIHNLFYSGACNVIVTDGTNAITFISPPGAGALQNIQIHVTNTFYIEITDTSGATNKMAYNGIETV